MLKNLVFSLKTEYGDLEMSMYLSKPEKDPKDIALALQLQSGYPAWLLAC